MDSQTRKEDLKKSLRKLYLKRGKKRPRTIDTQNDSGGPKYMTYIKYFGSWENALKEAGVDKDE